MKKWKIPVSWEMTGFVCVEANSLAEAIDIVQNDESIQLPYDGYFADGSWNAGVGIDEETIRECYNNNQEDEHE